MRTEKMVPFFGPPCIARPTIVLYISKCMTMAPNRFPCEGVGAQSTLGGTTFLPEKYVWKINKMKEFYMILARKNIKKYPKFYDICPKNSQNSRILHDFARKTPEFYIIARKIFSRFFFGGGGHVPPTPRLLRLCLWFSLVNVFTREWRDSI